MMVIRLECNKRLMVAYYGVKELKVNNGCYGCNDIARDILGHTGEDNDRPMPYNDGIAYDHSVYKHNICHGFESYAKFRRWFPYADKLTNVQHKARLAVYDIPDSLVAKGRHQVVMSAEHARLVAVLPTTCTEKDIEDVKANQLSTDSNT